MTHRVPLDMFVYEVGFLPLIKRLKSSYPDVTQSWHYGKAEELGMFDNFERYFNSLKLSRPAWGYYPKPTKIVLIMHPENPEAGELFGAHHGFTVCTVSHYIGGYIG